jgi:hypothetical protein
MLVILAIAAKEPTACFIIICFIIICFIVYFIACCTTVFLPVTSAASSPAIFLDVTSASVAK